MFNLKRAALRSIFIIGAGSLSIPFSQAQAHHAEVNIAGISIREIDSGWMVEDTHNSLLRDSVLETGDVIVKVSDFDVTQLGAISFAALFEQARMHNLPLMLERGGQRKDLALIGSQEAGDGNSGEASALGATFRSLEDTQRIVVTQIVPGSVAARAGLKRDDDLVALDNKSAGDLTTAQLEERLNTARRSAVHLRVRREGRLLDVVIGAANAPTGSSRGASREFDIAVHARGESAPPFTLPNLEGRSISLRDFQDKTVIVSFWGTWCPPCLAEAEVFSRLSREFSARLAVLGLNLGDEPKELISFLQERRLSYPVLIAGGFDSPVPKAYDVIALPLTIVVDPKGSVRYLQAGFPPNSPLESRVRYLVSESEH
jgi:peroxiredoxin